MTSSLVQEAKDCLSSRGGRMTAERQLILEALEARSDHPTAEEVYQSIKPLHPDLNLSTVYRTLHWLEHEGLISSHHFEEDHGQERFDLPLRAAHHHFICTICKQVIEFDEPLLETVREQFERNFSANVSTVSVVLYGVCSECGEKE